MSTATEPATGACLRWALADTAALAGRRLEHLRRRPAELAGAGGFPLLLLLMFAFLVGGVMTVPGGDYRQALAPGLFTVTMLFGVSGRLVAVARAAGRGHRGADPGVPVRVPVRGVRRAGVDAGGARRAGRVEPALGDRGRGAGAVRQPRLGADLVGRRASGAAGAAVAGAGGGRVRAA